MIRYDSAYLTCSKKLTGSQLSLPHGKMTSYQQHFVSSFLHSVLVFLHSVLLLHLVVFLMLPLLFYFFYISVCLHILYKFR